MPRTINQRTAAIACYLAATIFHLGVLYVLFDFGGIAGLTSLLQETSPARATAIFLLADGTVSLAMTLALLLIRSPSQSCKGMLSLVGGAQIVAGICFRSITLLVTVLAFGWLLTYFRVRSAAVMP